MLEHSSPRGPRTKVDLNTAIISAAKNIPPEFTDRYYEIPHEQSARAEECLRELDAIARASSVLVEGGHVIGNNHCVQVSVLETLVDAGLIFGDLNPDVADRFGELGYKGILQGIVATVDRLIGEGNQEAWLIKQMTIAFPSSKSPNTSFDVRQAFTECFEKSNDPYAQSLAALTRRYFELGSR